jgi:hypothetical protein
MAPGQLAKAIGHQAAYYKQWWPASRRSASWKTKQKAIIASLQCPSTPKEQRQGVPFFFFLIIFSPPNFSGKDDLLFQTRTKSPRTETKTKMNGWVVLFSLLLVGGFVAVGALQQQPAAPRTNPIDV